MEEGIDAVASILANSLIRLGIAPSKASTYRTEMAAAKDAGSKTVVLKKMASMIAELADTTYSKLPNERPVTESSRNDLSPTSADYWKLEEVLQRYEASIRDHVRIEQSIKIYSDNLKERNDALESQIGKLKEDYDKTIQVGRL